MKQDEGSGVLVIQCVAVFRIVWSILVGILSGSRI